MDDATLPKLTVMEKNLVSSAITLLASRLRATIATTRSGAAILADPLRYNQH